MDVLGLAASCSSCAGWQAAGGSQLGGEQSVVTDRGSPLRKSASSSSNRSTYLSYPFVQTNLIHVTSLQELQASTASRSDHNGSTIHGPFVPLFVFRAELFVLHGPMGTAILYVVMAD